MAKQTRLSNYEYDIEAAVEECGGRHFMILEAAREARRIAKEQGDCVGVAVTAIQNIASGNYGTKDEN